MLQKIGRSGYMSEFLFLPLIINLKGVIPPSDGNLHSFMELDEVDEVCQNCSLRRCSVYFRNGKNAYLYLPILS